MAAFVFFLAFVNRELALLSGILQIMEIILIARLISFLFVGCTSIIRFSYILPDLIIEIELSIFSIIFCAVPELSRLEPAIISSFISGVIL